MPLASTFMLSTKKGREVYVEPVIEGRGYRFTREGGRVRRTRIAAKAGTKLSRGANFQLPDVGLADRMETTSRPKDRPSGWVRD